MRPYTFNYLYNVLSFDVLNRLVSLLFLTFTKREYEIKIIQYKLKRYKLIQGERHTHGPLNYKYAL